MRSADELAHFEGRLLRERERALRALAEFDERAKVSQRQEDGDLTAYPLHLADEGTDTMEQEKDFLLASKEGRRLYMIDDALRTLYREPEKYGTCAECEGRIEYERLDLVPWTRRCVHCQRTSEDRVEAEEAV